MAGDTACARCLNCTPAMRCGTHEGHSAGIDWASRQAISYWCCLQFTPAARRMISAVEGMSCAWHDLDPRMAVACLAEHDHELEIPQRRRRHAGDGVDSAMTTADNKPPCLHLR